MKNLPTTNSELILNKFQNKQFAGDRSLGLKVLDTVSILWYGYVWEPGSPNKSRALI
jgi:hypothetical protein